MPATTPGSTTVASISRAFWLDTTAEALRFGFAFNLCDVFRLYYLLIVSGPNQIMHRI
jgi:hypothetical protein